MEQEDSANSQPNPLEDQESSKLLPRVSISNIKSPSKRHLNVKVNQEEDLVTNMLDFLPELKQFVSFFNIHFYYQKTITDQEDQLKQRYTRLHQTLITLESKPVPKPSKSSKTGPFSDASTPPQNTQLATTVRLVVELFELFRETISRPDLPSNILKGTLRTVSKLFEYKRTLVQLLLSSAQTAKSFKPGLFLKTMFECQFDTHDTYQEEVILLTIQKIVILMTKHFSDMQTEDELFKNCVYFFRVLKKRAINDQQITSLHMQEGTKQNMNKLFSVVMRKEDPVQTEQQQSAEDQQYKYKNLKQKIFAMFSRKILKNLTKIEDAHARQAPSVEITIAQSYACFIVKAFSESFQAMTRACSPTELKSFILEQKGIFFQVICRAGEFTDVVVRSMAQLLFAQILQKVLELKIPFREEIEVLYVKLLLKPLEQLDQKMAGSGLSNLAMSQATAGTQASDKDKMSIQTDSQATGEVSFLSDDEDNASTADDKRIAGQQAQTAQQYDPNQIQLSFELDVCLNVLIDTLLSLQPDQLAQLFLVYDCQPLSENLIRRSLHLLLKHSQLQGKKNDLSKCFTAIGLIMRSLLRYQFNSESTGKDSGQRGMQSILDMLAQKSKARNIAKKANVKPKAFFQAIEETFDGISQEQTCKLAAKVLLNSRKVSLDKIAEIIGGKDDRAKQCLEDYLERQDFVDCSIEKSLRGFLQTFRMAGVDSQVVFNILEKFGDKYFEKDHTSLFTTGAEAYNFAYLIIVLQTCQHNASIKEKTSIERFYTQAKEMVPESYDQLPEGMVESVFNRITQQEIKAPVTRDLINGAYDLNCGQSEIDFRTVTASNLFKESSEVLSESDFLSTADLREPQLFDMDNRILGVAPESLQLAALRQIVNILSAKFCQIRSKFGDSRFNQSRTLDLTKVLIQANGHFKNNDWVDRLILDFDRQAESFCRISKLDDERKNTVKTDLQNLFWGNFKSLSLATGLIPKMAPSMSRSNIHYASFNAVEVKIRNKFNKDIPNDGLLTRSFEERKLEDDSENAHTESSQSNQPMTITPRTQEGSQTNTSNKIIQSTPDPKNQQPIAGGQQQQAGLFNMVYNYFTPVPCEAEEEAKKREYIMSGQNQIDLLKHQLDDFNRHAYSEVSASQGPENVSDSYFFDFLVTKGIETSDALRQISLFIKENINSRRATQCLSYMFRVYLDSQTSQDIETSLQVRYTILQLCQNLVHQLTRQAGSPVDFRNQGRQSSYGNIPLTTEEDKNDSLDDSISQRSDSTANDLYASMNSGGQTNLAKTSLKQPKRNQFETEVATWVNKHLALELYFTVVGSFIVAEMTSDSSETQQTDTRPTQNQLIKDVQKTLTALSEDELTRDDFEQSFLYDKIAEFIRPSKVSGSDSQDSLVDNEDEGTRKPQESIVEESKKRANEMARQSRNAKSIADEEILPLREYPKIGKFLRLIIILMLQVNNKVCNKDQSQVSQVRLLKAISDQFLVQEMIPFDQINLCLDVLIKQCVPFKANHELSANCLEDLLTICQTFFQLLESGSDTGEQKMFQQGQFDLWFKIMTVLIQKILLSPYIHLYKSIQERTCTLVKIQVLTFQFQPLTSGQGATAASLRNYTKVIFEELVFQLNIACLQTQRDWFKQQISSTSVLQVIANASWIKQYTEEWEDEHEGFAHLCQLLVSTLTDVFIQYAQSMSQEQENKEESFEMFSILWNKFMLVLLNYADSTDSLLIENAEVYPSVQPLQQSIQDNIQRVMEFLLSQNLLLENTESNDPICKAKVQLYTKTKAALKLFWQEVQINKQAPVQL